MKLNILIGISALLLTAVASAMTEESNDTIAVKLSGMNEIPAILTKGSGTLSTRLNSIGDLTYSLDFSNLSSKATVAHIHFGQPGVNGGPMVFLCGGGTKPPCPPTGGRVNNTIHPEDILAVSTQGIHAGNMDDFLAAIRSGNAYVNVHSASFPSGEIRGQLKKRIED